MMEFEQEEEQYFPFDRVLVMGQVDGSWISVYIRRGFASQQEAIDDVGRFLGTGEINWSEFAVETKDADLSGLLNEHDEERETEMPEFMKHMWREDDEDDEELQAT